MLLGGIFSILIVFPVYIWVNISMLCRGVHGFFKRILIGTIFSLLGVTSLLLIDVVGHSLEADNFSNGTQCMFQVYRTHNTLYYPALNMHWSVLIPPSLLLGAGPILISTATLEFTSAQSPQSMKRFLIGIFFCYQRSFSVSQFNCNTCLFYEAALD